MIMDACVVIDFLDVEPGIFQSVSRSIGPLYVVSPVVEELHDIESAEELMTLGISVIEPELDDTFSAAEKVGALSFQDWLCLLAAKRHTLTCITNDKALRRQCEEEGVSLLWGLELLLMLNKTEGITKKEAEEIALKIHQKNPWHINKDILKDFKKKLKG